MLRFHLSEVASSRLKVFGHLPFLQKTSVISFEQDCKYVSEFYVTKFTDISYTS